MSLPGYVNPNKTHHLLKVQFERQCKPNRIVLNVRYRSCKPAVKAALMAIYLRKTTTPAYSRKAQFIVTEYQPNWLYPFRRIGKPRYLKRYSHQLP
jgi:hypothetical protein